MKNKFIKNGWGLRAELLFVLLFLFCLVVAVIGLNRFGLLGYNENPILPEEKDNSFDYTVLENKLLQGAKQYISEYYSDGFNVDSVILKYSTLKSYSYISKIVDNKDKECSGYVVVKNIEGNMLYDPYLKCRFYRTSGYDKANDW